MFTDSLMFKDYQIVIKYLKIYKDGIFSCRTFFSRRRSLKKRYF